uniref:Serine protease K12H4.7 n=1 Tax=Bursaphelenchus xylophilus TaxID=6326 RepID=A0A1I7RJZ9_BURXY
MRLLLFFASVLAVNGWFRNRDTDQKTQAVNENLLPESQWFNQKLDHFDIFSTETWRQQYFVNESYYHPGGPQILYVYGGSAASGVEIITEASPIVQYAKAVNARLWLLEHRYYGKSQPKPNHSIENLKFLSSRQALEDVANFIRIQNADRGIQNPRWVLFGGFYGGSLVLWSRVLHPELSVGAVGSSAPMDIRKDFYGYLQRTEEVYRTYISLECATMIEQGLKELDDMLDNTVDRARLQNLFNFLPSVNDRFLVSTEIQHLYFTVLKYFAVAETGLLATQKVCSFLQTTAGTPLTRMAAYVANITISNSLDINYYTEVARLKDESYSVERAWKWQLCTEFGYFFTTAFEKNIFGVLLPPEYYYNLCTDVFGLEYNVNYIEAAVQRTRDFYGHAEDYNGTNVLITNGDIDPWSALGAKVNGPGQSSYLIFRASHCEDLAVPTSTDVPELTAIRGITMQKLTEWIQGAPPKQSQLKTAKVMAKKDDGLIAKIRKSTLCNDCKNEMPKKNQTDDIHFDFPFIRPRFSLQSKHAAPTGSDPEPTPGKMLQYLDHFDANTTMFVQYFYANDKYYKPGGPALLFIGGEASIGSYLTHDESSYFVIYAKEVNAALYCLEHRYYGQSLPFADFSVENLKYLTSQQALADIAVFIETVNFYKGYQNPKWITFGGSYSGALSGWFRQKYPALTVGTFGSSGVFDTKVDFYEFMQIVQNSTIACSGKINEGFIALELYLSTTEGRRGLNQLLCNDQCDVLTTDSIDPFDKMAFYSLLYNQIVLEAAYNVRFLYPKRSS